jgi:hypothetical protein
MPLMMRRLADIPVATAPNRAYGGLPETGLNPAPTAADG